jgi:hypothetical protein
MMTSTRTAPRPQQAAVISGPDLRPAARSRWAGRAFIAVGLGMIPWIAVLAITLPASTRAAHWPLAWAGLDAMEGAGLLGTGVLLTRRDARCCLAAAVTATLIAADAWFDVTTAAPGAGELTAVLMAAFAEVPAVLLCAALAIRTCSRPGPGATQAGARAPRLRD